MAQRGSLCFPSRVLSSYARYWTPKYSPLEEKRLLGEKIVRNLLVHRITVKCRDEGLKGYISYPTRPSTRCFFSYSKSCSSHFPWTVSRLFSLPLVPKASNKSCFFRLYSCQSVNNPYEILGLDKNATVKDLKERYRELAKKYHPDLNPSKDAAETMAKISSAYHFLLDPKKRKMFDSTGQCWPESNGMDSQAGYSQSDLHFSDLNQFFSNIFSKSAFGRANSSLYRASDITTEVTLDFLEAAKGCEKEVNFHRNVSCTKCHGSGSAPGTSPKSCTVCHGSGVRETRHGSVMFGSLCSECSGKGFIISNPCVECKGEGRKVRYQTLKLSFFPGIRDGMELRVTHQGHDGRQKSASGDLFVKVKVKKHPLFTLRNDNLHITVPLTLKQILLGGEVIVPTLDKPIKVKVDENKTLGSFKRIKGLGMKRLNEHSYGDLIVEWSLKLPEKLCEQQKRLILEFDKYEENRK